MTRFCETCGERPAVHHDPGYSFPNPTLCHDCFILEAETLIDELQVELDEAKAQSCKP